MLYVHGIPNKIKKEGIAISISFHLILLKDCAIKTPTIINAGAVTCEVTTANKGENSKLKINKIPVVIAVIPERPPTAIPADDSTYAPSFNKMKEIAPEVKDYNSEWIFNIKNPDILKFLSVRPAGWS